MSSDLVVALIGAGGVVLGALVSGISGLWTARLTAKFSDRHTRAQQQRQAYGEFIVALDELDRPWTDSATTEADEAARLLGPQTAQAAAAIQHAYVAVLLTGSEQGREAADTARKVAWAVYNRLYPSPGDPRGPIALATLISTFKTDRRAFIDTAPRGLR